MEKIAIYHLDDSEEDLKALKSALNDVSLVKLKISSFKTPLALLNKLKKGPYPQIIILDLELKANVNGITLAKEIRKRFPFMTLLMYSSYADAENIKSARMAGVDEFISKHSSTEYQAKHFLRVYMEGLTSKILENQKKINLIDPKKPVIGSTMRKIRRNIPHMMDSPLIDGILITGEAGTGKSFALELLEAYLSPLIPRLKIEKPLDPSKPISEQISGAFGGWLFVDEIENFSSEHQEELIEWITSKDNKKKIKVAATSTRSLEEFKDPRHYCFEFIRYLLASRINLLPLRERTHEISDYLEHFISQLPSGPYTVHNGAMDVLLSYDYPNENISELSTIVNESRLFVTGNTITHSSLPERLSTLEVKPKRIKQEFSDVTKIVLNLNLNRFSFQECTNQLLLKLIKSIRESDKLKDKKTTLRSLSKSLNVSRGGLNHRLHLLEESALMTQSEFNHLISS
jgi:DNA-binding NtrC family response regulator